MWLLLLAVAQQAIARQAEKSDDTTATTTAWNILFILVDDLGWHDLGCMGSDFYETPHIDQLARDGMLFENAYSSCPVCSPTRASIQSGRYPARVKFTGHITAIGRHRYPEHGPLVPPADRMYLALDEITIAEALRTAGYQTASIGKWHLGEENYWPTKQGYDINLAGGTHGSPPCYFWPYKNPRLPWNPAIPNLAGGKQGEYLTDRLTDEAIRLVERFQHKPFFLYLSHYAVHTPLQAPQSLIEKYQAKLKRQPAKCNPIYGAMVENLDQNVGRLLARLDDLGLKDKTVVILASDNGGLADVTDNAPLRAGKGRIYEGGIRVPLLVRWPGVVKPGNRCPNPVTSTDFLPTLMEIAGVSSEVLEGHVLDGLSLVPLLRHGTATPLRREALYWHYPHYSPHGSRPAAAVRAGQWKLIEFFEDHRVELYNLEKDPGEQHNVAAKMPKRAEVLRRMLHDWLHACKAPMPTPNPKRG